MSNTTTTSSSGIGLGGMLFILFLGLKLGNVIDWSWWWVTSPLWIPLAIFITTLIFIGLSAVVAAWIER